MKKEFIIFERPKNCIIHFLAQDCKGYNHKLKEINPKDFLHEIIERIKKIPSNFPEFESNDYDAGYTQAKKDIIKEIRK